MSNLKSGFRVSTARSLVNEILFQRSFVYYFLGKTYPWEDDSDPPSSINSLQEELNIRNDLVYVRKVVPNDVSLVTYNNTWNPGTVYTMWDHTQEMEGEIFFVTNSQFNVYKCLDNNNGAPSTDEPIGNSLFDIITNDGYRWKYMYNIPAFKRKKFLSRGFVPVQRAVSDSFYNRGAIEEAVVLSPGSGYVEVPLTTLEVEDTRTGSGATAVITSVSQDGEITGIDITDGGSGYANVATPATLIITSLGGDGAVIKLIVDNGSIIDTEIVDGGRDYEISDTLNIVTEECILKPVISRTTGSFLDVVILNPGSGYATSPTITILEDIVSGEGVYSNPEAVIKAIAFDGTIVNVLIEDPGKNYGVDTSTTIVVQGDGEGALFTPVVVDGEIIDVIVENAGVGYSSISLTAVGLGTGAVIEGIIIQSDFVSDQSIVEQAATPGAIHAIKVTEPGNNYSADTQVEIVGDGIGATAVPVIQDGRIIKLNMTSVGANYTRAQVIITDAIRPPSNDFIDAEAYAILPPLDGHGFDATQELFGNVLSIYSLLQGDLELSNIGQEFRQYGIIKNPLDIVDGRRVTSVRYFTSFDILVSDASTINPDDVLINNSLKYRVISKLDNTIKVIQLAAKFEVPAGAFTREDDPEVDYGIVRVDVVPVVDKYSGDLLFVTNTTPFTPTTEQVVAVRSYIEI